MLIRESSSQGAAGTWLLALTYRNLTKRTCRTGGYPGVTLYSPTGKRLPKVTRAPRSYSRPRTLLLKRNSVAYGVIAYPDNFGGPCRRVAAVRVYAPNSTQSIRIRLKGAGRACGGRLLAYPLASSPSRSLNG